MSEHILPTNGPQPENVFGLRGSESRSSGVGNNQILDTSQSPNFNR